MKFFVAETENEAHYLKVFFRIFYIILIIIGSIMFLWDLPKLNYVTNYSDDIKLQLNHVKEKAKEVEEFTEKTGHSPNFMELNCPTGKCTSLMSYKIVAYRGGYKIHYYMPGAIGFAGHKILGPMTYVYDPKTGKSNNDYRSSYTKMLISILLELAFDLLLIILSIIKLRQLKHLYK